MAPPYRAARGGPVPGQHPGIAVLKLRQFLVRQGYHIPDQGESMGEAMRSALKNWSSGVHNRNPAGWNKANHRPFQQMDMNPNVKPGPTHPNAGRAIEKQETRDENQAVKNTHDALAAQDKMAGAHNLPKHGTPPNSPKGTPHPQLLSSGGGGGFGVAPDLLNGLISHTNTEKMLPLSLADDAASPYTQQAATFADQISRLPAAKKQALKNIGDWFGQVQGAEKKGAARDQLLANQGSAAMASAAKGIAAGLGGAASGAAGQIGAVGANDANTMKAIGANDAALADELAPIFKLASADAKNTRSQQYDNQLSDLQDQEGQARGQGDAARAAAVQAILAANNSARQNNYGNAAGLYNTLAGLQISGMNAASEAQSRQIENAYRLNKIRQDQNKSTNPLDSMTPSQRAEFADKITQGIKTGQLSWPDALRAARNSARTAGMNPFGPQVIQSIIGPALANAGITNPGGGFWAPIYKR